MKVFRFVLFLGFMSLLYLGGFYEPTYAKGNEILEAPTIGQPADKKGYGGPEKTINTNSTTILKGWGSSIFVTSDTSVKVSGEALTYGTVDKISISLFVQVWNDLNDTWVDYLSLDNGSISNKSAFSFDDYAELPQGYYYRAKAKITATDGSIDETITTYSKYIYLN